MPENLIPAIIALAGVFISVLSSLYISMRQTRIETQKLRNEYIHRYAGKLFEKRLETYPKIVEPFVIFLQNANLGRVKIDDIRNLLPILLEWDAKNSTFLSAKSQHSLHKTYHMLFELGNSNDEELSKLIVDKESLKQLRNKIFEFYLALKNDLGIYSFKSPSMAGSY